MAGAQVGLLHARPVLHASSGSGREPLRRRPRRGERRPRPRASHQMRW